MKYSSRVFLYAPLGVFLVLLAIAGIHWWIEASALADWLNARNGREIMPGVKLSYTERHTTGFPFSLDTEMHDVRLTLATRTGPLEWRTEKFAMHALAYGRDETIFEAAGHQTLLWPADAGTGGRLSFAVGALRASAIRSRGELERFDLDILGFGSGAFTAQRLQLHLRHVADRLDTFVEMDGVRPAGGLCPALGEQITRAELKGDILAADAFAGVRRGDEAFQSALAAWRKAHGMVQMQALTLAPHNAARGDENWLASLGNGLRLIPAETLLPAAPRALCLGPRG